MQDNELFVLRKVPQFFSQLVVTGLQTDHKNIMKQIENGLQGYYSSSGNNQSNGVQDIEMRSDHYVRHETPFAKITLVSPGSPAEIAVYFQTIM